MSSEVRTAMIEYWKEHSQKGSLEEMMLDNTASIMAHQEATEIMSFLPSLAGKEVVELGAGIGRFTGLLAAHSKKVTANDFMKSFLDKNEATYGHLGNIDYVCADVTKLNFPPNSMDMVFSNWLFMYLEDEEVSNLLTKILSWLKNDGFLFFRESCFHKSGNMTRGDNPTKYRDPDQYAKLLYAASFPDMSGINRWFCFDCLFTKPVLTYVKLKGNPNQLCWMVKKSCHEFSGSSVVRTKQDQLDLLHYRTSEMTLRSQHLYASLDLKPTDMVLDVGSGIGIHSFFMAQVYGSRVIGVDFSANMVTLAMRKLNECRQTNVIFEVCDITNSKFDDEYFDVIHCRDTLFHFPEKNPLLSIFYRWLKPGGRLFITDYTKIVGDNVDDMPIESLNEFHVFTEKNYTDTLESVGFTKIRCENETKCAIETFKEGIATISTEESDLLTKHSSTVVNKLLRQKRTRLEILEKGQLDWTAIYAKKL